MIGSGRFMDSSTDLDLASLEKLGILTCGAAHDAIFIAETVFKDVAVMQAWLRA
jgi:hypothetical protein